MTYYLLLSLITHVHAPCYPLLSFVILYYTLPFMFNQCFAFLKYDSSILCKDKLFSDRYCQSVFKTKICTYILCILDWVFQIVFFPALVLPIFCGFWSAADFECAEFWKTAHQYSNIHRKCRPHEQREQCKYGVLFQNVCPYFWKNKRRSYFYNIIWLTPEMFER